MQTELMTVSQLNIGDTFRINFNKYDPNEYLDYRLIFMNQNRAFVEPLGSKRSNKVTREDGSTAEWESPRGRHNITIGAPCTLLRAASEDDMNDLIDGNGLDDLLGDNPEDVGMMDLLGELPKPKRTKNKPKTADGKRELDPQTKRGQVVAMFRAGKTPEQVCEKLSIKRSCAMSHLSDARKYNGVQYEVSGGKVRIK